VLSLLSLEMTRRVPSDIHFNAELHEKLAGKEAWLSGDDGMSQLLPGQNTKFELKYNFIIKHYAGAVM
jgi:hypothetical protein